MDFKFLKKLSTEELLNLKTILETLDLVVGDDLVVFSSVTKLGVKDVIKKIEGLVEETI